MPKINNERGISQVLEMAWYPSSDDYVKVLTIKYYAKSNIILH